MKYPGGKGKCYQHLINLMPPHQTYIESHLGGGAVMRNKKPALRNIGLDLDSKVIEMWKMDLPNICELHQLDAVSYLGSYTYDGNELVYVDPPYLPETRKREKVYRCDYTENDHVLLLKCLIKLPCNIMISGYDNDLYNGLLSGWRKVHFSAKTHTGLKEETVWMNFEHPDRLHDTRYIGKTFRDRQNIQRRQSRLRSRIEKLDPIERNDLYEWMREHYEHNQEAAKCN
ncbi:MAG: DNA adenine methylase [Gammaproteobacteria bacterium]|jgi:site-specific DNA-adenine methylase|nr:DNA adenine methylase [Gammaproteobacteria bacterium]MBU1466816.1 DNA adenine methylase [Gammaproteobacteria bacterium]MBU2023976.1 DNA adenine methylase [Gammaproteobacteria bacterium]MBU2239168.1 DNA adenine methylase [Gammaproteobacteria bacterium]MBU2319045.1 DNA adenine methylase [Gammaproteobacteria bacterium]